MKTFKRPVIIYSRGGRRRIREQKGGSVVTENLKGITENFRRIQRRDHLENEDIGRGGGGIAKVIKCY